MPDHHTWLQKQVTDELKDVRKIGLDKLDELNRKTGQPRASVPYLELAAQYVPGFTNRLTRSTAVELLLRHEIPLLKANPCREWLPLSFGLTEETRGKSSKQRRHAAYSISGSVNLTAFQRADGGDEFDAIAVLAAQIVADCLQDVTSTGSQLEGNEVTHESDPAHASAPEPSEQSRTGSQPKVSDGPAPPNLPYRTILLSLAAAGVGVAAVIATVMSQHADGRPTPPAVASISLLNPTQPILIQSVSKLNTGPNDTKVSQEPIQLTPAQLTDGTYLNNLWSNQTTPTDSGAVDVTFKSNTNETVTIADVEIVKKCQAPLSGTVFYGPPAGEGDNEGIGFNLDSPVTYAQDWSNSSFTGQYFDEHHITVAPNEAPQTISLHVATAQHFCTFTFKMDIASSATANQTPIVETITDRGKPFAISATFDSGSVTQVDFSKYQDAYITGLAARPTVGGYVQVNPKTYPGGAANPLSYPPTR